MRSNFRKISEDVLYFIEDERNDDDEIETKISYTATPASKVGMGVFVPAANMIKTKR